MACHGQKAEKKFDPSLPDEQLIRHSDERQEGLRNRRTCQAYGEKGVTAEQAKALPERMKQLKSAPHQRASLPTRR